MNARRRAAPLGNFVDTLVQSFENCRAALPEALEPERVETHFRELYDRERPRLADAVRALDAVLDEAAIAAQYTELDQLITRNLIPAYARLAREITRRERNDFYLAPSPYHGLERAGWAVGGILVGAFVVWAPFIPIWSKEAVLPFAIGGLLVPELRKLVRYRVYAREVNRLVGRIEDEARHLQSVYLEAGGAPRELPGHEAPRRPLGQGEGEGGA